MTSLATLAGCDNVVSFNSTSINDTHLWVPCNATLPHGAWSESPIRIQSYQWYSDNPGNDGFQITIPLDIIWVVNGEDDSWNQTYPGVNDPLFVLAHAELDLHQRNSSDVRLPVNGEKILSITRVTECVISMCARTYDITISRGELSVIPTSTDYGRIFSYQHDVDILTLPDGTNVTNNTATCWKPGHGYPKNMSLISKDPYPSLAYVFQDIDEFAICPVDTLYPSLTDLLTSSTNKTIDATNEIHWYSIKAATPPNLQRVLMSSLKSVLTNITASLTKYSLDVSNFTVNGTVVVPEVYVSVDWGFLALPAMVLLLGIVFFVSTILVNREHKLSLWKSSLLPVLYHGLGDELVREHVTISSMEEAAQSVHVRLRSHDTVSKLR